MNLYTCFVDLEKAYDRVPREALFKVIEDYGVQGKLLRAVRSLYSDSRDAVRVDGSLSGWFQVN